MSKSRRSAAKRTADFCSFHLATAQINELHAGAGARSSGFNAAAFTRNLETLFDQVYRRCRAGPPPAHLMAEHRTPSLHAASSPELCA
jgi:hypothetical protein